MRVRCIQRFDITPEVYVLQRDGLISLHYVAVLLFEAPLEEKQIPTVASCIAEDWSRLRSSKVSIISIHDKVTIRSNANLPFKPRLSNHHLPNSDTSNRDILYIHTSTPPFFRREPSSQRFSSS